MTRLFDLTIVGDGVPEADRSGTQFLYIKTPQRVTIRNKDGDELSPTVGLVAIYLTDADARVLARDINRELRRKKERGL